MVSLSLDLALHVKGILSPGAAHTCSGLSSMIREPEGQSCFMQAHLKIFPNEQYKKV